MPFKTKEDKRAYHREYYRNRMHTDPEFKARHMAHVHRGDERRLKERQAVIAEFRKDGCKYCPEKEHCALDAHHIDPSQKEDEISNLGRRGSIKILREEIKKCICVCKNCHSKIHAGIITV